MNRTSDRKNDKDFTHISVSVRPKGRTSLTEIYKYYYSKMYVSKIIGMYKLIIFIFFLLTFSFVNLSYVNDYLP